MSTKPCIILVRPVAKEIVIINKGNPNRSVDFISIPSVILKSAITEAVATAGMLRPILANADPKAKLRLVCSLLLYAALMAAIPSGNKTIPAIMIPTNDLGAPAPITKASTSFERYFANKTTIPKHNTKKIILKNITFLVGFSGRISFSSLS